MAQIRADAIVQITYAVSLLAPAAARLSFRLARARRYVAHRRVQLATLGVAWLAVLALEARIRVAGGSGAFVAQGAPAAQPAARALLAVHITVAVATYLLWSWLALASWRRFSVS